MAKLTLEQKEKKRWQKLRSAIRNVWQYDHQRKAVIDGAVQVGVFECPLCGVHWPKEMATVDHNPQLGGFTNFREFGIWVELCFTGPQRCICKLCHRKVTASQRRKKAV